MVYIVKPCHNSLTLGLGGSSLSANPFLRAQVYCVYFDLKRRFLFVCALLNSVLRRNSIELFKSSLSTVKMKNKTKQVLSFAKRSFLTLQESHGPLLRPTTFTDSRLSLEKKYYTCFNSTGQGLHPQTVLRLENMEKKKKVGGSTHSFS